MQSPEDVQYSAEESVCITTTVFITDCANTEAESKVVILLHAFGKIET